MKYNKNNILFINSPNPKESYSGSGNFSLFPSLGVISLATHLSNNFPDYNIKVIDGGIHSLDYILEYIDSFRPFIVVISVLTPTYIEGLKIAKYAKEKYNSIVILGNDHASFFPEIILKNRPFIDYVVKAEFGEQILSKLIDFIITGRDSFIKSKSSYAVYFKDNDNLQIFFDEIIKMSDLYKDEKDIPNLKYIKKDIPIYTLNYNEAYKKFHNHKKYPMTINTARGCKNGSIRCLYCSIYDLVPKHTSPEFFWLIVEKYYNEYKINFFFEVADEFLTFRKYIKELVDKKPFDLKEKGIEFEIYARADDVLYPDAIWWLKELNVTRVNLGLDSGDNNMLNLLRKNLRYDDLLPVQINYEAVKLLAENNITIHASFPIGCLGETKESLRNTLNFIKKITTKFKKNIATLEVSELIPLPSSPAWDILFGMQHSVYYDNLEDELKKAKINVDYKIFDDLRQKYFNNDLLDLDKLSSDWLKYFTHITYKDVENMKNIVETISQKIGAVYGRAI